MKLYQKSNFWRWCNYISINVSYISEVTVYDTLIQHLLECVDKSNHLAHWSPDKVAAIFQMISSNVFYVWSCCILIQLSTVFPMLQLTICHHWFRLWFGAKEPTSHYLNQWWRNLIMYVTRPLWVNTWYRVCRLSYTAKFTARFYKVDSEHISPHCEKLTSPVTNKPNGCHPASKYICMHVCTPLPQQVNSVLTAHQNMKHCTI